MRAVARLAAVVITFVAVIVVVVAVAWLMLDSAAHP